MPGWNLLKFFADLTHGGSGNRRPPLNDIAPPQGENVDGYKYLGRGPGGSGWNRSPRFAYRCAKCGDIMPASFNDYYDCTCRAMSLDKDAGRFGSNYGDENILRYAILNCEIIDSLTSLLEGDSIEVTKEFNDYDGKTWPTGKILHSFKSYSCVPYHGGYTFYFADEALRMCDLVPENCDVMFNAAKYFRLCN